MEHNLSTFGHSFQIKSIICYMTKLKFLEQIYDIIDENMYDSDSMKWIVKECKVHYKEYHKLITFDVFKVKVNGIKDEILKTSVLDALKHLYQNLEAQDLEFVQDKTLEFFKNQSLKKAIVRSVDILESESDFEKIKTIIDSALNSGVERNVGHEYMKMIEDRYSEQARATIKTPWDIVNDLMQGGLGAGELGVILAPAGVGKTWILSKIGSEAMRHGKIVMHYTLELNEEYTGLRYDSIFTGIPNQNLKYHKDEIEKKLKSIPGELIIKQFPTKFATVDTLSSHLQRTRSLGNQIDFIVVDYADVMRDTAHAKEVRHALGNIYEDLRGLAGEFEVPVWTASQANRSALEEDIIDASKVAESYQKIMTADFVMSLSRKVEDKIQNTGRFHVIKNRFGPDGLTYPAKVNTNTGTIELFESTSIGGLEQQEKINNRDNIVRKMLANKYKDLIE